MEGTDLIQRKQMIKRGDVYYANLEGLEIPIGSEQKGNRPVLIIQNNKGNEHSTTTIVAILTTNCSGFLPTHIRIAKFDCLKFNSTVCLEQIRTIDKIRLIEYLGNIGPEKMEEIDKAIYISLGVDNPDMFGELEDIKIDAVQPSDNERDKCCSDSTDWTEFIENQLLVYSNLRHRMILLKAAISEIDGEIQAILNYIESTNYNTVQGYKVYKILRDHQKKKRSFLKEQEQLEVIINTIDIKELGISFSNILTQFKEKSSSDISAKNIRDLLGEVVR